MTRPTRLIRAFPRPSAGGIEVDGDLGGTVQEALDTLAGDRWKQPCRVATTGTITISTGLNSGDTIDGVTLANGDRVLVKDQSTGSQNGIYVVSASPARATDFDEGDEVLGSRVHVYAGTANAGKDYRLTNTSVPTIGSTTITFAEMGGGSGSLTVEDADESYGSVDTLVFAASGSASVELVDDGGGQVTLTVGSSGGGGLTQAYVGYNTAGGSTETPGVNAKVYCKSVTLANDCLITSIGAYVQIASASDAKGQAVALYEDNAGTPGKLLGHGEGLPTGYAMAATTPRWIEAPLGVWVPAGTYWIAIRTTDLGASVVLQISYDGSGSDKTATGVSGQWHDGSRYTFTTTSNRYSIRANTIR